MKYDEIDIAGRYDSARRLPEATLALWLDEISEHIPADEIRTIIDVGCGTGRFSAPLADRFKAEVIGIDPSMKMLAEANRKVSHRRVNFLVGDAEYIPVTDGFACLIYLSMVYHHILNPHNAAGEFRRVLHSGGFVCIRNATLDLLDQVPYLKYFPPAMEHNNHRIPSQRSIIDTMQTNGFSLLTHKVIQHQFARTKRDYFDKIKLRGLSDLVILSDAEFEAGINRMKADMESGVISGPVIEPIDLFIFQVETR